MKRIFAFIASLGLVALMLGGTTSAVFAVSVSDGTSLPLPVITVICPQTADSQGPGVTDFNWYISLYGTGPNYNMDWSTNGTDWSGPNDWSDQGDPLSPSGWGQPLTTTSYSDNGGNTLWVRWTSDPGVVTGPISNNCTIPLPPVTTCAGAAGGTASFSDVPAGWKLVLHGPGANDWSSVTSGFGSIALAPGSYTYQWRDAADNDQNQTNGQGSFIINACAPLPPVLTCGGAASFSDVPAGWYLALQGPGANDWNTVTSGFDSIALAPGTYHYQWRDAGANDQNQTNGSGDFTIVACVVPPPPVLTCGGTASFSDVVPAGWYLALQGPGANDFTKITSGFNSLALAPGTYHYQWRDAAGNDQNQTNGSGDFTISACVVPNPPTLATSCGGSVTFSGLPEGWSIIIDGTKVKLLENTTQTFAETVGVHTYSYLDAAGAPVAGGTFTIVACVIPCIPANNCFFNTPTPTPTPVITATPTPVITATPTPITTPMPTPITTPTPTPVTIPATLPPTNSSGPLDGPGPGAPVSGLVLLCAGALLGVLSLFVRRRTMTR